MASVTQTIPQYSLGMSEQPDNLKFPGQVTEVINAIPDLTRGLFKRPGAERKGANKLPNVQTGGSWFHYYRDESEGSYIGQINSAGTVRIWKASGTNAGAEMTVTYNSGAQGIIEKSYLSTGTPENLQFLTINDTTFVCNRDSGNANTAVGHANTTQARPDTHFGFLELLRTENGRQYAINLHGNNTEQTTLKRATRIKIQSDTLNEGDGTGSCPGVGTQVFSVSGSDFAITTSTSATFTTSADSSGNANRTVTVAKVGHGLKTGDQINITSSASGFTNLTKVVVTKVNDNSFLYVAASDQGSHTSAACTLEGPHKDKSNLIFRVNTLGQQGVSPNFNASSGNGPGGGDYRCSYSREAVLLHGGEDWETGDRVTVTMDSASENFNYTIEVEENESTVLNATINTNNNGDGVIRPEPTPFDADTAVTADTIIGGIIANLPSGITAKHIGNGIYFSSTNQFQLEVVEDDLMRCFQSSINDVQNLPNQCKDGYIVKVTNALRADEDDYYLKFEGQNGKDGSGSWVECAEPGIPKTLTNMPLIIQRTATANTFIVKPFAYEERRVGDELSNPLPSFIKTSDGLPKSSSNTFVGRINKVLFFRNRLAFLSGENVILSRPGTIDKPDFFAETALTVSASDPIDISAASTFPSELFDGIDINTGLLVFSSNQQFLLSSDDTVLNPDTAKLRSVSTFNYNQAISPISLGTTVAYVDNSGKFSRFNEMANIRREGEPNVVEVSKIVPTLLPKDIDLLTNSRENSMVLLGKTNSDTVFGYKYFQVSDKRQQAAWFKWKFNNPLLYHFIINDEYYFLDTDHYLQCIKLVQTESEPSITQDNVNYLLHVDNYTDISGGSFSSVTNTTTFSNVGWLSSVTTPNHDLVIVDTNTNTARLGRYGKPTVSGTTLTVTGNWELSGNATLKIGYIYPYEVKFPTFYPTKQSGNSTTADVNSSLILHRLKLHFGKIGLYKTTLKRVGKVDYSEIYESTTLNEYDVSDAPYVEEFIKTVPVYERNINVDVVLESSHPAPATLRSVSWEGDYTPRFYKRV